VLCALALGPSAAHAEETVRIAIVDRVKEVTLAGKGLEVRKLEVGERYAPAPGGRSVVRLSKEGMLLDGAPVKAVDGVKYRSEGFVRVADQPVRGQIEVRVNGNGLIAINVLPLEDYLAAVLGSEMPASFPLEARKAQAVAARTYAVRRKIEAWGKPFHLGATVLHQVYGGAKAEDARTREAVRATRGEVLTWKMEPIEAYFHASCGGHTESGEDALGRALPYLKSVACSCGELPKVAWSLSLGPGDFQRLAEGVKDLKVLERSATGRARRVLLASAGGNTIVSGVELRRVVGYDKIRSLDFEAERKGSGIQLRGHGHGHGAGMCQWGAKAFAEQGWDYRRILAHYYLGTELRTMY
jgi:stage II sporulation protein D